MVAEDALLLKGNVPSPEEWRSGWSVLSETVSLRKAARIFEKQKGMVISPAFNKQRKRYRKQLCVMAEVLRIRIRKVLREATSISLALDECKYRKVLRYRCDLPSRRSSGTDSLWRHVGAGGFSHSGVLGIIHCKKSSASEFEEDHGMIVVRQLHTFLEKCCTPLGRIKGRRGVQPLACDYDLLAHIKKTV